MSGSAWREIVTRGPLGMALRSGTARRRGRQALVVLGATGWLLFALVSVLSLTGASWEAPPEAWQFDWHVYAAGGRDLADRELYWRTLEFELPMPVDRFNLPPMSALWALPLLWLPVPVAGLVWQAASVLCLAYAMVVLARLAALPAQWWAAGLTLGVLALNAGVVDGIVEGTNNNLVLALLAAFADRYLAGRDRSAGVLLGLAVATKLWPAALVLVLVRDRRWPVLAAGSVVLMAQAVVFLAWLGPGVVGPLVDALTVRVSSITCCGLIGFGALREAYDWWPVAVAPLAALIFALAPARGRAGIGLGMLAGLLAIPNLWMHYLPTVVFAVGLAVGGIVRGGRWESVPDAAERSFASRDPSGTRASESPA